VSNDCPVCPYDGLDADDLHCPSCGTELAALRRVQQLPLVLLADAERLAASGDRGAARLACGAAAAFPQTRARALALLARVELHGGHLLGAARAWRGARAQ